MRTPHHIRTTDSDDKHEGSVLDKTAFLKVAQCKSWIGVPLQEPQGRTTVRDVVLSCKSWEATLFASHSIVLFFCFIL
jgi:hypothetical protein